MFTYVFLAFVIISICAKKIELKDNFKKMFALFSLGSFFKFIFFIKRKKCKNYSNYSNVQRLDERKRNMYMEDFSLYIIIYIFIFDYKWILCISGPSFRNCFIFKTACRNIMYILIA